MCKNEGARERWNWDEWVWVQNVVFVEKSYRTRWRRPLDQQKEDKSESIFRTNFALQLTLSPLGQITWEGSIILAPFSLTGRVCSLVEWTMLVNYLQWWLILVTYNKNDDSITRCSKVSIHSICTSVLLHYVVVTPIRESGHKAAKLSLDLLTWMTSPPRRGTSSASSERTVADSASSRSRFRPRDLGRSTTGRSERIPGLWSGPEQSLLVSLAWCSRPRCSPRCRNPLPFPEKFSPWNRSSTAFKDEIGFWERLKFRLNHVYNVRSRSNFCSSFEIYNLGISKNKNV